MIYRSSIGCKKVKVSVKISHFELMEVILKISNQHVRLSVIYRPPNTSLSEFLQDFTTYADSVATSSGKLLILGDFNIHVDNPDSVEGRRFTNTLSGLNLEQHVNSPTHTKGHTLDLIITRTSETVVAPIQTHAAVMSDHLPMTFDLRIQKPPPLKVEITSRKLKSTNANSFTEDIRQSALVKNPAPGLEDLVDQYHSVLSNILDAHAPLITRHVQVRQRPPWFNDTILEVKRDRRRAERKWLAEKTQGNMYALQFARARVNTLCESAKKSYYRAKITEK